ncbi:MAG: TMEM43 family protein [Deltaproteobacteria bacterium]|nr:TMEM43 family protein [Deltaproteobacteria bacterium]
MPDVVSVVTKRKGFGGRLADSIKGIFFGFILFIGAFPLLWWGEGRQNLAEFVQQATRVEPAGTPAIKESPLIKTTGIVSSAESVTDPQFLPGLSGENILQLERNVQMYAWDEDVKTEERGEEEIKTYTYTKEWTSFPSNSSNFNTPGGHENPPMTVNDESFKIQNATVGELAFDAGNAEFYELSDMSLEQNQTAGDFQGRKTVLSAGGKYLYLPLLASAQSPESSPQSGSVAAPLASPQIGDLRISYAYYPANKTGTVVGDWDGNWITPHIYRKTGTFLGVYPGTAEMFAAMLERQHRMITWIIRIGSLFMMWIGMNMILGPILVVMEKIPVLGALGRGMIGLVTGAIAFVLWLATLIIANLWALLVVAGLLVIIAIVVVKKKKGETAAAPAVPA